MCADTLWVSIRIDGLFLSNCPVDDGLFETGIVALHWTRRLSIVQNWHPVCTSSATFLLASVIHRKGGS